MANTAISLCHMVDKAMSTFMEKRDREFVEEGGVRERMTAARLDMRGTQKQIIARQEQEITALKACIASLEREIAVLRGGGAGETRGSGDSGSSRDSRDSGGSRDSRETGETENKQ